MRYLRLARSQAILACFAAASLLLAAFPRIDIDVSRMFFDKGFYLQQRVVDDARPREHGLLSVLSMACSRRTLRLEQAGEAKRVRSRWQESGVSVSRADRRGRPDRERPSQGQLRPREAEGYRGVRRSAALHRRLSSPAAHATRIVRSRRAKQPAAFLPWPSRGLWVDAARWLSQRSAWAPSCHSAASLPARIFSRICVVSFFVMLIVADVLYYYLVSAESERLEEREAVIVGPVQPVTTLEP